MAKSRSESLLRGAEIPRFTRNRLRNLKDSPGEDNSALPGQEAKYEILQAKSQKWI